MEKRIQNVYDYESYRLLLSDDFARRVAYNNNYSLRSYANDIGVSAGYISKVINNKKDMTIATGIKIFTQLGFSDQEIAFSRDLIELNTTADQNLKIELENRIRSLYPTTQLKKKNEELPIVNSVAHFLTYALINETGSKEKVLALTKQLNMSKQEVLEAIAELDEKNFIEEQSDGSYVVTKDYQIIGSHNSFCEFGQKLANFFYEHYKQSGINRVPDSTSSSLVLGFDDSSIEEVYELQKHCILTLIKISERCADPNRIVFLNNLFLEKPL